MDVDSGRGVTRVSVGMRVSVAGADVAVDACASVDVAAGGSVAGRALHEESSSVISTMAVNIFMIISNSFAWDAEFNSRSMDDAIFL